MPHMEGDTGGPRWSVGHDKRHGRRHAVLRADLFSQKGRFFRKREISYQVRYASRQPVRGEFWARQRRNAGTQFEEAATPEGLVGHVWNHERGPSGAQPRGRGSGAAVMNQRGHAWKEPIMGDLVEYKEGFVGGF